MANLDCCRNCVYFDNDYKYCEKLKRDAGPTDRCSSHSTHW